MRSSERTGGYGAVVDRDTGVLPELIEGDGIILRRWQVKDAELLGVAVEESIEHLAPWMSWTAQEPLTVERRRSMLAEREREWANGGDVMLAVFTDGCVAGSCGLHRRIGPGGLELGYWIRPAFTRRGLATRVARALTGAAFSLPGIERVEIHHDKANEASAGIPAKLGFSFIGDTPDEPEAPAEVGIQWVWRMCKEDWPHGGAKSTDRP